MFAANGSFPDEYSEATSTCFNVQVQIYKTQNNIKFIISKYFILI